MSSDFELDRWSRIYSGSTLYYGEEPGPVARRAVRYHRPILPKNGTALDAGCGEGQDLAFLAQLGYATTGVDFTAQGTEKARDFLAKRELEAEIVRADLRTWSRECSRQFDLVLAVNCLQFLGADAMPVLENLMNLTAPDGVLGVSMFAREGETPDLDGSIYFATLSQLLEKFGDWQPLEAAQLWQWSGGGPQPFVTLIAHKSG